MIERHRFAFAGDGLEVDRPGLALSQADHAAGDACFDIARAGGAEVGGQHAVEGRRCSTALHVAQDRQSRLQFC